MIKVINKYRTIRIGGKKVKEHRNVMERYLNRSLLSSEIVHHINGDCSDNRLDNLIIVERIAHIKIHHTGAKRTEDSKKRMSLWQIGKKLSDEHKNKLSRIRRGRKNSPLHNIHISIARTGTHLSEETKEKIRKSKIGISSPMLGKKHTEESKQKMRDSLQKHYQKRRENAKN